MKAQFKIAKALLFTVTPILLVLAVFLFYFQFLTDKNENQIDLVRLYQQAEKKNIGPNDLVDRSIVINKPWNLNPFIRNITGKVFTDFSFLYRAGQILNNENSRIKNGGVSFLFSKNTTGNFIYDVQFRKKNDTTSNVLSIKREPDSLYLTLKINRPKLSGEFPVTRLATMGEDLHLYLVFFDKSLLILDDKHLLYYFEDPEMPESGDVSLQVIKLSSDGFSDDNVKIARMDSQFREAFAYYAGLSEIEHWAKDLNREWNDLRPEHLLILEEKKDAHIQRVRLGNITKPAITVPANAEIIHKVEIPKKARLNFSSAVVPEGYEPGAKIDFIATINSENNNTEIYAFPYRFKGNWMTSWQDHEIDLSKFGGKNCFLTLSARSSGKNTHPIVIWGAPVINAEKAKGEKNIILISLDTLRADHLGSYGYFRDTSPIMDKLAAKGSVFLNTIASSPWTLPSHISMLSGLYPMEAGAVPETKDDRSMKRSRLAPEIITLAEYLKASGYNTCAVTGSGFVASYYGFDQGFDTYIENVSTSLKRDIAKEVPVAIDWIKRNRQTKFFMFFHTFEIHHIYLRRYFKPKEPFTVEDQVIANYDSGIRYADRYIGQILKTLDEEQLTDETLIIITSDHGENFDFIDPKNKILWGKHGKTLKDSELKVPLIMAGTPEFNKDLKIATQVRSVDIVPTILDYVGIEPLYQLRGKSLMPLIQKEKETRERLAYSESLHIWSEPKFDERGIRTSKRKMIEKIPIKHRYDGRINDLYRVYDLERDPLEKQNIFNETNPEYNSLKTRLKKLWDNIYANSLRLIKRNLKTRNPNDLMQQLKDLGYINPR